MNSIYPKDIENYRNSHTFIDVRSREEFEEFHLIDSENIPLHTLPARIHEFSREKKYIFVCLSGARSAQACLFAEKYGIDCQNFFGGIQGISEISPKLISIKD